MNTFDPVMQAKLQKLVALLVSNDSGLDTVQEIVDRLKAAEAQSQQLLAKLQSNDVSLDTLQEIADRIKALESSKAAATHQHDAAAITNLPSDIACSVFDKPANGEFVLRYITCRAFKLPAGAAGSYAKAQVAATASAAFTIQKNGASVGTINFAAGQSNATFTVSAEVSFAAGDRITIVAPASADSTLADVDVTLKCILG